MKVFIGLLLLLICTSLGNPYTVDYVSGVVGFVELVEFDSEGNVYVASFVSNGDGTESHTFYKLSSERELISTVPLPSGIDLVYRMHVTKEQDVYFMFYTGENLNNTFGILRSGSEEVVVVEQISHDFFFLDPYDNLYYGRKSGLHILRPGSNTPVPIKNLEDFYVFRTGTAAVDLEGNVYFAVDGEKVYNNSVALLTKEEIQNEVPTAQFINVQDDIDESIQDIIVDERNNIWVITEWVYNKGFIKKLTNGTYETVKDDPTHPDLEVTATKDRIWVVAANVFATNSPSIYYITLDGEVIDIPELQNLTEQMYFFSETVADNDGRAYIKTYDVFTPALGSMIIINPGETKPIPVKFNPSDPKLVVDSLFMDIHENVWIFSSVSINQFHHVIKKGETTANIVSDLSDICDFVTSNPVTKEVFLGCVEGLVVAINEN